MEGCKVEGQWICLDYNRYVVFTVVKATFQSGIGIGQDLFLGGMLHAVPYPARWRWSYNT